MIEILKKKNKNACKDLVRYVKQSLPRNISNVNGCTYSTLQPHPKHVQLSMRCYALLMNFVENSKENNEFFKEILGRILR